MTVVAVIAVAVMAGCAGTEKKHPKDLRRLVLQPSDLPKAFVRFAEGRLGRSETAGDPARFGRDHGWRAGYKRPGSAATRGPLVVDSRVELFRGEDGSERELAQRRRELGRGGDVIRVRELGEAAWAADVRQDAHPADVRTYTVFWRHGDIAASVVAQGFDGRLRLDEVLALARRQQRRLERAAA